MGAAMGTWVLISASWYKMGEIYAREGELVVGARRKSPT